MSKYLSWTLFAAVICGAFCLGWSINGHRLNNKIEQIQNQYKAEKEAVEKLIATKEQEMRESISKQANDYQKKAENNEKTIKNLKQELKNVQNKNPLPASCVIDDERMSIIRAAYSQTNTSTAR